MVFSFFLSRGSEKARDYPQTRERRFLIGKMSTSFVCRSAIAFPYWTNDYFCVSFWETRLRFPHWKMTILVIFQFEKSCGSGKSFREIGKSGNLEVRKSGNREIGISRNQEIKKSGYLSIPLSLYLSTYL